MFRQLTSILPSALLVLLLGSTNSYAVTGMRLIGITGNQGVDNDETLYEIDLAAGTVNPLFKLPFVPDTDSIAFNPRNGLLYRTSGASNYSNNPASNGFRDNHYMQTVDVRSGTFAQSAIYNANSEQFGLPAPKPSWVVPAERRLDSQTGNEFRISGPNEYHSIRDLTWSSSDCSFYAADEDGIFKVTPQGDSTFLAAPGGQPKGIAFTDVGGVRTLYLSDRDGPELWRIDPVTGQHLGAPVMVKHPTIAGAFVDGLLSLETLPNEPMLFAIQKIEGSPYDRQVLLVDPVTGNSTAVVSLGVHMADLAFVYNPPAPGDIDLDGVVDRRDAALMAQYFGTASGATTSTGNFNCDGQTTLADLAALQAHLDAAASPAFTAAFADSTSVPEPGTVLIAMMGFAGIGFRRVIATSRR
jgi:hypothetical protein